MSKLNKTNKKSDFKFYTKDFEVDTKASNKRIITGFATTSDVDRQFDVISEDAIKGAAEDLLQNPTVFYEHKHSEYPIGKVIDTKIMGGKLLIRVEISKTADQVWTLIQEGILRCFSIGGRFLDFKTIHDKDLNKDIRLITKLELFEVSIVGLPANASAIITDVSKAIVKSLEDKQIEELEEKQRGEGQGQDNPRQGDGGTDTCICSECGYETEHERGKPCNEIKCPECGSEMTGKSKENDKQKDIDKEKESKDNNEEENSEEEDNMDKNLLKVAKESLKDFEAIEKDLELEFLCKGKVVSIEDEEEKFVTLQIDEVKKLEEKKEEAKEEKEVEEKEDKSVYEILEKFSQKLDELGKKLEEKKEEKVPEKEPEKEEKATEPKEEKKKAKRKGIVENEKELSEEEEALEKIKTMTPTQIMDDTELFKKLPKTVQADLIKSSIRV